MIFFDNERAFLRWVLREARSRGWHAAHFENVRRGPGGQVFFDRNATGFPDVVLVRERFVVAELKIADARLRPEQIEWITRLRDAGIECHLWRSHEQDEILTVLEGGHVHGTRLFATGFPV